MRGTQVLKYGKSSRRRLKFSFTGAVTGFHIISLSVVTTSWSAFRHRKGNTNAEDRFAIAVREHSDTS